VTDWTFEGFGERFDEHARAHLPHYRTATDLAAFVASFALPRGGLLADLGVSTGSTIESVAAKIPERSFSAIGYDLDESMLDVASKRLSTTSTVSLVLERADLSDPGNLRHEDASVTLALWTLQFLPRSSWVPLLSAARLRSDRDGVLLVAAKTRLPDARWQEIGDAAVVEWKAGHAVAPEEVLSKARSLRGTMLLVTLGGLLDAVEEAGWRSSTVLFRWHQWVLVGAWAETVREVPSSLGC
jgi:tRNA (cmo5U34)-methyltransferase